GGGVAAARRRGRRAHEPLGRPRGACARPARRPPDPARPVAVDPPPLRGRTEARGGGARHRRHRDLGAQRHARRPHRRRRPLHPSLKRTLVRMRRGDYPGRVDPLSVFTERTRDWFARAFDAPTPAQERGWPVIATGAHTLIQAPTGSGKTLAAFLYGLDRLDAEPGEGIRLLYVSPLKALNYDVERNLRGPLAGLQSELQVAVRTGDTPQRERQRMLRHPPDILITTPESLFLMLTSHARDA